MVYTSRNQTVLKDWFLRSLVVVWVVKNGRLASEDCVSFAGACLPIGHDYSVESIQDILYNGLRNLLVRIRLIWLTVEHTVEKEVSGVILLSLEGYLLASDIVNIQTIGSPIQNLFLLTHRRHRLDFLRFTDRHLAIFLEKWPDSNNYSEIRLFLFLGLLSHILLR